MSRKVHCPAGVFFPSGFTHITDLYPLFPSVIECEDRWIILQAKKKRD
jgi:hypothetical protein